MHWCLTPTCGLASDTCAVHLPETLLGSRSDDGSGNQEWTLTAAPNNFGVYDVQCSGRATCANYLSVQQCDGTIFPDLYFMDDSSGRQQWRFVPA